MSKKTNDKKIVMDYVAPANVSDINLKHLAEVTGNFNSSLAVCVAEFTGCGFDKTKGKFLRDKNLTVNLTNIACRFIREKLVTKYKLNNNSLKVQISVAKHILGLPVMASQARNKNKILKKYNVFSVVKYDKKGNSTRYTASSKNDNYIEKLENIIAALLESENVRDIISISLMSKDSGMSKSERKDKLIAIDAKLSA